MRRLALNSWNSKAVKSDLSKIGAFKWILSIALQSLVQILHSFWKQFYKKPKQEEAYSSLNQLYERILLKACISIKAISICYTCPVNKNISLFSQTEDPEANILSMKIKANDIDLRDAETFR